QGTDDAVAGRGLVEADDVAGGLAAEDAAPLTQEAEHVAVADLGTLELDAALAKGDLEAEVGHHGADHGTPQGAVALACMGDDEQELIAVEDAAEMIDHDEAIAVAVEREAHVSAHAGDRELQQLGSRGAAAVVDVAPVGRAADGDDLGAEIGEHPGAHFV